MSDADVLITRVDPDATLPSYARPGDAGADLVTCEDVDLAPGQRAIVRTGVAVALPAGYAAFVHPRSGLAAKHGVTVVNGINDLDQLVGFFVGASGTQGMLANLQTPLGVPAASISFHT